MARLRIDGHAASMAFLVTKFVRACLHDLKVIIARQASNAVGPRDAQIVFRLGIPGRHLIGINRPIQKISPRNFAIVGFHLPFMFLETKRGPSPVNG